MQTSFSKWSKLVIAGVVTMIAVAGCSSSDTSSDSGAAGSATGNSASGGPAFLKGGLPKDGAGNAAGNTTGTTQN